MSVSSTRSPSVHSRNIGIHGWVQKVVASGLASMPSRSDAARSRSFPDWMVTALTAVMLAAAAPAAPLEVVSSDVS